MPHIKIWHGDYYDFHTAQDDSTGETEAASGFDRGHIVPSADRVAAASDEEETAAQSDSYDLVLHSNGNLTEAVSGFDRGHVTPSADASGELTNILIIQEDNGSDTASDQAENMQARWEIKQSYPEQSATLDADVLGLVELENEAASDTDGDTLSDADEVTTHNPVPIADEDPMTSEGIFVFEGSSPVSDSSDHNPALDEYEESLISQSSSDSAGDKSEGDAYATDHNDIHVIVGGNEGLLETTDFDFGA